MIDLLHKTIHLGTIEVIRTTLEAKYKETGNEQTKKLLDNVVELEIYLIELFDFASKEWSEGIKKTAVIHNNLLKISKLEQEIKDIKELI